MNTVYELTIFRDVTLRKCVMWFAKGESSKRGKNASGCIRSSPLTFHITNLDEDDSG